MTIDAAYQLVNLVINKRQQGYITPDQFNNVAPTMQLSLINDRIGNAKKYRPGYPIPAVGFGLNQKTREELRPLLIKPTATAVTAGVATIPADYLYYDTVTAGGYNVQEVQDDELAELNNSLIKPPTTRFPKMTIHSNGINIFPTSITTINLSYLRKPVTPVWGYTTVNDEPVYNAGTSQDFETSSTTHLEICNMILSTFGMSLNLSELVQYAEMGVQQGK